MQTSYIVRTFFCLLTLAGCFGANVAYAQDTTFNPLTLYMLEGKPIRPWELSIGDEKDKYSVFKGMKTASRKKKVLIEQTSWKRERDAISVKWSGKSGFGQFSIGGNDIDLSALEDQVALAVVMRKDGKISGNLGVGMFCDYPCRGSISINALIEPYPKKEWFTLVLPLKCFANAGADLSKIDTPFHIETAGRARLSFATIRLAQIPKEYLSMCASVGD